MNRKGQTLIEALVALGVSVVIISAVAISVITAVNNADNSKIQNQASAYATSEMELLHQQSIANWTSFSALPNTYCADENANSPLTSCSNPDSANVGTLFKRQVDIVIPGGTDCPNVTKVTVTVSWKDGKCPVNVYCHNTKLESCFTNINSLPTP